MAERVSTYLGEEAVRELDRLCDGLGELSGCEISRSAAISSMLTHQAGVYLETRRRMAQVTAKYLPGGEFGPLKPINPEKFERFSSLEEWVDAQGLSSEGEEAEE